MSLGSCGCADALIFWLISQRWVAGDRRPTRTSVTFPDSFFTSSPYIDIRRASPPPIVAQPSTSSSRRNRRR